ncbi:MAG: hypothetical protein QXW57_03945, partial [Candidatus Micrarchaeaceae archaeon]
MHPRGSPAKWNDVFSYLKLPYTVKEERSLVPFVAVVGVAASICADLIQYSFLTFIAVQFFASMGIMVAVT